MLSPVSRPPVPCWGFSRVAKTATFTVTSADRGVTFDCTSGTYDAALTAAATLGSGFVFAVYNSGAGTITVNPNGAETILTPTGSVATIALTQGQGLLITCTGTGFEVTSAAGIYGGVSDGDKGDITVSGSGATWTIDSAVVTFAKIQNLSAGVVVGREGPGSGVSSEFTITGGLAFNGAGGIHREAITGDVSIPAGSNTSTIQTVTIADSSFTITGSSDTTKRLKFEVDAMTANDDLTISSGAQTDDRTLSIPVLAGNDTLATLAVVNAFTGNNTMAGTLELTTASSGLTISKTTGTTLTVSSTDATAALASSGCVQALSFRFSTGVLLADVVGGYHSLHSQAGNNCILMGGAGDPSNYYDNNFHIFRTTSGAAPILTLSAGGFQFTGAAGTSRAFVAQTASLNRWSFGVEGTAEGGGDSGSNYIIGAFTDAGAFIDYPLTCLRVAGGAMTISRPLAISSTTDSTSIVTGSIVTAGGIGVAKRLTLDGATGKTIKYVNGTANAAVAVTFGAVGPTGSTAGNQVGWVRIDINGTDRYIPYW